MLPRRKQLADKSTNKKKCNFHTAHVHPHGSAAVFQLIGSVLENNAQCTKLEIDFFVIGTPIVVIIILIHCYSQMCIILFMFGSSCIIIHAFVFTITSLNAMYEHIMNTIYVNDRLTNNQPLVVHTTYCTLIQEIYH